MKLSPTSSLFPLITPSTVPLVRRERKKNKERHVQKKNDSKKKVGNEERQKKAREKMVECAFDTWESFSAKCFAQFFIMSSDLRALWNWILNRLQGKKQTIYSS